MIVGCVYACVMMYKNVMFVAGENKSRITTGEKNWILCFLLGRVNEDDYENKPAGEDNSTGE